VGAITPGGSRELSTPETRLLEKPIWIGANAAGQGYCVASCATETAVSPQERLTGMLAMSDANFTRRVDELRKIALEQARESEETLTELHRDTALRAAYSEDPQFWRAAIKKKLIKDAIDAVIGATAPFAPILLKIIRLGEEAVLAEQKLREHADEYSMYLQRRCERMKGIILATRDIENGLINAHKELQKKLEEAET
jgi:hypothetical protein